LETVGNIVGTDTEGELVEVGVSVGMKDGSEIEGKNVGEEIVGKSVGFEREGLKDTNLVGLGEVEVVSDGIIELGVGISDGEDMEG
jgi:hypothetical protein